MTSRCIRVLVSGRVQGVGFRAWTHNQAKLHQLHGYVQNCDSGQVEAVLDGSAESVASMLALLHEGPRYAEVAAVTVCEELEPGTYPGFSVRGY